mmetsp:Transcript_13187/g.38207  ORF Transcript_13187/g.38207 Transcript_13187/m.38207 type:complete len:235 (+) Transcript_13187:2717-3421(+)
MSTPTDRSASSTGTRRSPRPSTPRPRVSRERAAPSERPTISYHSHSFNVVLEVQENKQNSNSVPSTDEYVALDVSWASPAPLPYAYTLCLQYDGPGKAYEAVFRENSNSKTRAETRTDRFDRTGHRRARLVPGRLAVGHPTRSTVCDSRTATRSDGREGGGRPLRGRHRPHHPGCARDHRARGEDVRPAENLATDIDGQNSGSESTRDVSGGEQHARSRAAQVPGTPWQHRQCR